MPHTTTELRFASGLSEMVSTVAALDEVLNELTATLSPPVDLAVVFASADHAGSFDLIHERVVRGLGPRTVLGVTAEGVIGRRREVEAGAPGLSILAARLGGATVTPFNDEQLDLDALKESPESLREQIGAGDAPVRAMLMLADPFSIPMVSLLPTLGLAVPAVPVVGGMASGAEKPGGNRLLLNGRVTNRGAIAVTIGGDLRVDCTVSQGCRPIGQPCVITRSQRHVIQEIGGQNSLVVVQQLLESLDGRDRHLVQNKGLLVGRVINEYKERFGRGDFLIKHIVGVDEDSGYIAIADPQVRVGQTIQFHVRDDRTAEEDFRMLLQAQQLHGAADGALLFSCNGRGTRLFEQPNADVQMVHDALGDLPLAGFFAAGEFGPVGGENFVHGHTASLMVMRAGK